MATAGSGDVLTGIIAGIACLYKYEGHHQNGLLQWLFIFMAAQVMYVRKKKGINGTVAWDIAEAVIKLL